MPFHSALRHYTAVPPRFAPIFSRETGRRW